MNDSSDSQTLTESLLSVIRLQRHLGTRVILSTQEPTVSPKLLDLCSTVIVHRFTSPAWFIVLRKHLAGVASSVSRGPGAEEDPTINDAESSDCDGLFSQIVTLKTGEALMFCPSASVGVSVSDNPKQTSFSQLGNSSMKLRVRKKITADGGQSIMAN